MVAFHMLFEFVSGSRFEVALSAMVWFCVNVSHVLRVGFFVKEFTPTELAGF